ncbi:hypothetical protein SUGI_0244100 [Cryptomeria japonica]|nr:hypothetical protein SUGI_0244100 [Cryptomeria japonica]
MNEEANGMGDKGPTLQTPYGMTLFVLSHRVVMAPMTRCRALNHVPQDSHVEYYSQRATNGGLIITEASAVAPEGFGFPNSPGIYTEEQIEAWRRVVSAVHKRGGIIFCQIWHVGRASHIVYQPGQLPPVSSTDHVLPENLSIQLPDGSYGKYSPPTALTTEQIPHIVEQFRRAAKNALLAGFDGVEIHGAHGYLIDQFSKNGINDRNDRYGGSIENRCRFMLEVLKAVTEEIGESRTALRISPIIDHLQATDSDPHALGMYMVEQLNQFNLAYLHVTEPRFTAKGTVEFKGDCSWLRKAFKGTFVSSGGYDKEKGEIAVNSGYADLVSYGRLFISNPDLPLRFFNGVPLNPYDRSTFYTHDQVIGYTDYPAHSSTLCLSNRKDSDF